MKMPTEYIEKTEWTLVGPMGPMLPAELGIHPIIGVDGGAAFAPVLNLWVGDSDSHNKEIPCKDIFRHPTDKADSDLALALGLLSLPLPYRLHLWGFLGGRRDHELFNLGECFRFLDFHQGSQVLLYDSSHKVRFHLYGRGHWQFTHHGLFSIGVIDKVSLKLSGACRYSLDFHQTLAPLSSLGLSNEAWGEVRLENKGPLFVYFPGGE